MHDTGTILLASVGLVHACPIDLLSHTDAPNGTGTCVHHTNDCQGGL